MTLMLTLGFLISAACSVLFFRCVCGFVVDGLLHRKAGQDILARRAFRNARLCVLYIVLLSAILTYIVAPQISGTL